MQLSIIIVNYNVKYFLEHCLLSVLKACKYIQAEVLVVDNNSTDGSKLYLESKFSDVQFFWNDTNVGFGRANNAVLDITKGECILFLNPDTIVPEDCFINCLEVFKANDLIGAIGVQMLDGAGKFLPESKRNVPTAVNGFLKIAGLHNTNNGYYASKVSKFENATVPILAGAFMMLSKQAIVLTKGFDADFFMYGEDVDLSYRITKAGLHTYYLGNTQIIHFKGESTQKVSKKYTLQFYGAMQLFIKKHYQNQQIKMWLMHATIQLGKVWALVTNSIFKNVQGDTISQNSNTKNCLVVCNLAQQNTLKTILQRNNYYIKQWIDCTENIQLDVIKKICMQQQIENVVLAENDVFTNKNIIELLEQGNIGGNVFFYQNTASSIIGSTDKNKQGVGLV